MQEAFKSFSPVEGSAILPVPSAHITPTLPANMVQSCFGSFPLLLHNPLTTLPKKGDPQEVDHRRPLALEVAAQRRPQSLPRSELAREDRLAQRLGNAQRARRADRALGSGTDGEPRCPPATRLPVARPGLRRVPRHDSRRRAGARTLALSSRS